MSKLYYFAHPYTGDEEGNFNLCCSRSAELIKRGWLVYSPIAHTHPIHRAWLGTRNVDWYEFDNAFIRIIPFAGIILAPGWRDSEGCVKERELFKSLNREILSYEVCLEKDNEKL